MPAGSTADTDAERRLDCHGSRARDRCPFPWSDRKPRRGMAMAGLATARRCMDARGASGCRARGDGAHPVPPHSSPPREALGPGHAWLGGARRSFRNLTGHTGRTGGLTLHETFEVTLEVVGPRAAGFRVPDGVSSLLPGFPSDLDVVDGAPYAPLVVTMPRGDDFSAAVSARTKGEQRS